MTFSLAEAIKLALGGKSLPRADKVRFYTPDLSSFFRCIKSVHNLLDASVHVINTAHQLPERFLYYLVCSFSRSYMLSVHYDVYLQAGIAPQGFTPNKVKPVLSSAFPLIFLDMIRELIRPMVYADGSVLYPDVDTFNVVYDYYPSDVIRNNVILGHPDTGLLRFGIMWFPVLSGVIRSTMMDTYKSGLTIVENTGRDYLEFVKASHILKVVQSKNYATLKAQPSDERDSNDISALKKDFDDSSGYGNIPQLYHKGPIDKNRLKALTSKPTADHFLILPSVNVVAEYYINDFGPSDETRDFAARLLRPHVICVMDSPKLGTQHFQDAIDVFPLSLQHFGRDIYRGLSPYSLFQYAHAILHTMDSNDDIDVFEYYSNRYLATLGIELKDWSFPSLGVKSEKKEVVTVPLSDGPSKRKPRRKKQTPDEQKPGSPNSNSNGTG